MLALQQNMQVKNMQVEKYAGRKNMQVGKYAFKKNMQLD